MTIDIQTNSESHIEKKECSICGNLENTNNIKEIDTKFYCSECYDKIFIECSDCGEMCEKANAHFLENDVICENCFDDNYRTCNDCNEIIHLDDTHYGNNDYPYCEHCYFENGHDDNNDDDICYISNSFKKLKSKTFKENKYRRLMGVELETSVNDFDNQFNKETLSENWSIVSDGSIDNSAEFVSCAMGGDTFNNEIFNLCKKIKDYGYSVNSSCGFHLHINAKKSDVAFLKNILLIYSKYEKYLFYMLPKSRTDNHYCKQIDISEHSILSISNLKELKSTYYNTQNQNVIKSIIKTKYDDKRYYGLNLHSFFYRGTIEIRYHSGTLNTKKIINWSQIHLRLFDIAKKKNSFEILEMKDTLNSFLDLFSTDIQKYIIKRINEFNQEKLMPEILSVI
ncbi:MAG: amidoligase family protein [Candidatus Pacearchaeota archaeon]|jgi:hypothetical protein